MKVLDVIKLAILNIVTNLKMAISILIGFIIIMEVVMISLGYGYSMNKYIKNIINTNSSDAYCCNIFENFSESEIEEFRNDNNVEGVQILEQYDIYQYCQDNNKIIDATPLSDNQISFDAAIMKLDDTTYRGKNDFSYDFALDGRTFATRTQKIVKFEIGVIEGKNNLQISNSERQEFEKKYNSENPFLIGGEFTKENQIILTDYILEKFGCNYNAKDCIGKKISLYVVTEDGELCIVDDYELCGVIDSNFYRINSRKQAPQILLSNANPEYCAITTSNQKIFGYGFREIKEFYYNNVELDTLYIASKTLGYAEVEIQQLFYNEVVLLLCAIIIISVVVFVYILIYFYFRKRTRYVCIQKAMGMSGGKLYALIFGELSIMAITAAFISIPIYYGILQVLNDVISMTVSDSFKVTKSDFVVSVYCALIITLLLNVIISAVEYKKTKKYTVVNREKII